MKAFNINEAKAGKAYCTRSGKKVRILSINRKNRSGYNIVALVLNANGEETIRSYMNDGTLFKDAQNPDDLMMKTTLQHGWVCLYKTPNGNVVTGGPIYDTKADAETASAKELDCIGVTDLKWEE